MTMRLLDKYIAKTVIASIALVTLALSGLQIFMLFVNQLDALGRGDFGILQAALYVMLQMPYQVYLFFPVASMLGCLIGLGIMANHRELIVMRAAGMSISQITLAVLKAALILIMIVTVTGETVIPKMARFANDKRMQALSQGQALRTASGIWLRYKNDFITIDTIDLDNRLYRISQFRFDNSHHLELARAIESITFEKGQWLAHNVSETLFNDNQTQARHIPEMVWDVAVRPAILNLSSSEPDEMTLHELRQYLRVQKANHQTALSYQLAYWQRIIQPLTTVVMMVLAIPFIFGPLRSSTMGSKLLAGATVGFGFHMVNHFFGPISQVFQWPMVIAAVGPTVLFALLGIYLMRRVK